MSLYLAIAGFPADRPTVHLQSFRTIVANSLEVNLAVFPGPGDHIVAQVQIPLVVEFNGGVLYLEVHLVQFLIKLKSKREKGSDCRLKEAPYLPKGKNIMNYEWRKHLERWLPLTRLRAQS